MKQNLVILIYSLASGGAERVVSILLDELRNKFDITLVLMNNTINFEIPKNQKVIYLEKSQSCESGIKKLLKLPYLAWKYKEVCKLHDIQISLSFMNRPNYINVLSKILGNQVKIIISERATPSLQHKSGLQGFMNRFLIRSLYPKADVVIANSKGNSLDLKNNFYIDKVVTINNPVQLQNSITKQKNEKFTFVTIGRLDYGKNHQLIINAMQEIDAKLLIIGDGELKEELINQIKELGLRAKVFLLGQQNNPSKYLFEADCFVFSSSYEGFPNVLLEALSCSLPIISTDCKSGPREILAPTSSISFQLKDSLEFSEYGILTPLKDVSIMKKAMQIIIKDELLREQYQEKARVRASDFNKEKIMSEWIEKLC